MSAAEHLREAIAEGCTRDDEHDHIADHRAEVLDDLAKLFDDRGRALPDGGPLVAADTAALIRQHAADQPGKASLVGPTATHPVRSSAVVTSAILTQLAALQEIAACCSCGASTCPSTLASLALTGAVVAQPVPSRNSWLREQAIRDRLTAVDIRDSAAAWDLGMSIISILDGPLPRPQEREAPDPVAYGPAGYRSGCGKDAHSNLTPCAPDDPAAADFFQPGQTYTRDLPFRAPEDRPQFQCVGVGHHPSADRRRAFGFEGPGSESEWVSASQRDEEWAEGWVALAEEEPDHGCMEDVFTEDELYEMQQDGEYRMDAEDDAQHAEQGPGQ